MKRVEGLKNLIFLVNQFTDEQPEFQCLCLVEILWDLHMADDWSPGTIQIIKSLYVIIRKGISG